jgi:hypothetical protein
MSSVNKGSALVDEARRLLCDEIARCIREKSFTVRIRIGKADGAPTEAWFYSHCEHGWRKSPQAITDRPLVSAMDETLAMLASKTHHDAWLARRKSHSDGDDIELEFHADRLKERVGGKLESVLMGMLFRDQHDSTKDKRRSVRTPAPKSARR